MRGVSKVAVLQLGARRHYLVPRALSASERLGTLYTDFYLKSGSTLRRPLELMQRLTGFSAIGQVLNRNISSLADSQIHSFNKLGLSYILALRNTQDETKQYQLYAKYGREFCLQVVNHGFGDAHAVYGFNNACLEAFKAAKSSNLRTVMDQTIIPIGAQEKLLRHEVSLWPGWQDNAVGVIDTELERREREEWKYADRIVCGSDFLKEMLVQSGVDEGKCSIVTSTLLGQTTPSNQTIRVPPKTGKLKLLFVGEIGLRKGAQYLLEALRQMKNRDIEAKFVGRSAIDEKTLGRYSEYADFIGHVPQNILPDYYRWADVLVLPSLCEGSAMVTYEAQFYGLAIICTNNTGANFIDGIHGLTIEASSTESLISALSNIRHIEGGASHSNVSFENYQDKLLSSIFD